jgi:hypothetical protein
MLRLPISPIHKEKRLNSNGMRNIYFTPRPLVSYSVIKINGLCDPVSHQDAAGDRLRWQPVCLASAERVGRLSHETRNLFLEML